VHEPGLLAEGERRAVWRKAPTGPAPHPDQRQQRKKRVMHRRTAAQVRGVWLAHRPATDLISR
jgi:hypothetical protein